MAAQIGNTLYTNDALKANPALIEEAFLALCNLPETEISPHSLGVESQNNRIVIKEREMLLKNASDPQEHIGTVNQWTCCTLYVWDEADEHHGLIHVSAAGKGIVDLLEHFEDKKNVKAILVGGMLLNESTAKVSKHNILNALKVMIASSQHFTIVSQRVLGSNKISPSGILESFREGVLDKARIFYRKMLSKPMPEKIFAQFSAKNFIETELDCDKVTADDVWNAFYNVMVIEPLMAPVCQTRLCKENELIAMLTLIFSKQGYEILRRHEYRYKVIQFPELVNFTFNTKSKAVHKIIDKEEAGLRQLYLYDPMRGSRYYMSFHSGRFFEPRLSQQFRDDIINLYPLVKEGFMNDRVRENIADATVALDEPHTQIFSELVLEFAPIFERDRCTVCTQLWAMPRIVFAITEGDKDMKMHTIAAGK